MQALHPVLEAPDQSISTWFLVLGLFLPRITLLAAYFTHTVPPNTVPVLFDVLGGIFGILPNGNGVKQRPVQTRMVSAWANPLKSH